MCLVMMNADILCEYFCEHSLNSNNNNHQTTPSSQHQINALDGSCCESVYHNQIHFQLAQMNLMVLDAYAREALLHTFSSEITFPS